jgi:hypothetical protein
MLPFQIAQDSVRIKAPNVVFQIQAVALEHIISWAGPLANTQPATRGSFPSASFFQYLSSVIWAKCVKWAHYRNANSVGVGPSISYWGSSRKVFGRIQYGMYRPIVNHTLHQAEI